MLGGIYNATANAKAKLHSSAFILFFATFVNIVNL